VKNRRGRPRSADFGPTAGAVRGPRSGPAVTADRAFVQMKTVSAATCDLQELATNLEIRLQLSRLIAINFLGIGHLKFASLE
jgi:hypothetical protein